MKQVKYTDEQGRKHLSTIRDMDSDPSIGFLQSPPDLDRLNWQELKVNLHNLLVDKKLFTIEDVQRYQQEFNHAVLVAISKPIFRLYQEEHNNGN